jgi:hypothetical protein
MWGLATRGGFLLLVLLAAACPARADSFPWDSVDKMCDEAEVIVEGEWLGKNLVRIDKVLKAPESFKKDTKEIEVGYLDKHDRNVDRLGRLKEGQPIKTKQLVLFLEKDRQGSWRSRHTIDVDGTCGSCGLFWFDDDACYGYAQFDNPGPYVLFKGGGRVPKNIAALRAEIAAGLENSRRWRAVLAVKNPQEKAKALAAYLLPRTSPPWCPRRSSRTTGIACATCSTRSSVWTPSVPNRSLPRRPPTRAWPA